MFLRLAIAQVNPVVGDIKGNTFKVLSYIERAAKNEADIVVFPELVISGYPPEDLLLKPHFVQNNIKAIEYLKKHTKGITAIVGFADKDKQGNVYNAAAVLSDGKITGAYHKRELPNYSVFDEQRYFVPQNKNLIFRTGKMLFGVTICEDIWKTNGPYLEQVNAGVGLVINISASPYHAGKMNERAKLIKDVAVKNRVFVCYVNTVGGQDDLVFDGASFIMSPDGKIISAGKEFEEDLIFADIPLNAISRETGSNKKKDLRTINLPLSPKNKVAKITPRPIKKLDRTAEIYAALVTGTRDYFAKNGFKHAVLGLSGGIDSALVAAIAVDAIGKDNVAGVSMPSKYSSGETMSDAEKLANNLGIKYINVPIKDIHKSYMALLDHILEGGTRGVTEENIQARIRGNILMAFSNKYGWLVLTTGNKSETAVGYCTLYGDMAGGFAVIKDVPKTLVYELADHVNSKAGKNIIPESIIERAPTAELKPGQKDSDSLPEYDLLDPVLKDYIEEDMSFESLRRKYPKAGFIEKVMKMVDKNEYKRRQAAPGIRITSRAFGRDRRLPITNKYDDTSKLDLDDSRG